MKLENIKAIETDMDGTIFLYDQRFSEGMIDAFKKIKEASMIFVVNTGRGVAKGIDILKEADVLKYVDYVIGSNGIEVYDVKNDTLSVSAAFEPETISLLCEKYLNEDISLCVYEGKNILASKITPQYLKRAEETGSITEKFDYKNNRIKYPKMIGIINPENYEYFHDLVSKDQNEKYQIYFSCSYLAEITPVGTSKYLGSKLLFQKLGIDEKTVISFGDGENDINMMKGDKIKVAMGHAPASLKNVCDFVTSDVLHDGVKEFLDNYVF